MEYTQPKSAFQIMAMSRPLDCLRPPEPTGEKNHDDLKQNPSSHVQIDCPACGQQFLALIQDIVDRKKISCTNCHLAMKPKKNA